MPGREGISEDLARAIIGGLHRVLYRRLDQGREAELTELAEPLWNWTMSYAPPPQPLRASRRRARLDEPASAPPFAAIDTDQRVIRAFAAVVAEKGYAATTVGDVAGRAGISQRTFYEHFEGKRELLDAALDSSGAQVAAAILPAVRRAPDWPDTVRVGFEAMCRFLVAEPAFARLREVEVYAAGPEAIELRDRTGTEVLAELLRPAGTDPNLAASIFSEATVGAIYSTLHHHLRSGEVQNLLDLPPFLTYVALAPVLGPERACEVANGEGRKR